LWRARVIAQVGAVLAGRLGGLAVIIVWSRWGIMVPLFAFIAFVGAVAVVKPFHFDPKIAVAATSFIGGLVSSLAIFFATQALERKEPRVLIDAATNRRVVIRPNAGHFFFIPTRYWPYIVGGLALIYAVSSLFR
jgi:hypothetical protein